jgi:CBS domain-containing protein
VITKKTVADIMVTRLHTLNENQPIDQAMLLFLECRISGAPVLDDQGLLVGILSEKDCISLVVSEVYHDVPAGADVRVKMVMSKDVFTIPPTLAIHQAASIFHEKTYRRLPVIDDGKLVGQISRRDVLAAIRADRMRSREYADVRNSGSMVTDNGSRDTAVQGVNRAIDAKLN